MKKYSLFFIFSFLFLISNVNAAGESISATVTAGSVVSNPVYMVASTYYKTWACEHYSSNLGKGKYFCGRDKNGNASVASNARYFYHMQVEPYTLKLETGETYKAICIDPLLQAPTKVTCSKLATSDLTSKMASILNGHLNDTGSSLVSTTIAIRNLAGQMGIVKSTTLSNAITAWSLVEGGGYAEAAVNYFKGKTGTIIDTAKNLVNNAATGGSNDSDYAAGSYIFTFTQTNISGSTYTFEVKVDKKVPNDVTFSCKRNCTLVSGELLKGTKKGTVVIRLSNACPTEFDYIIGYKFRLKDTTASGSNNKTVYKCTGGSNKQQFVTLLKAASGNQYSGQKEFEYKCDECKPPTQNIEKTINMCCDSGDTSSVREPLINKLFCDTNKSDVKVIGNLPGPQANSDYREKNKYINEYCKTWCTERIIVQQPNGATVGRNGKYFKLNQLPDSAGPKFTGYKTCRLVTDYKKWQGNYVSATKSARDNYNNYQSYQALANSYRQAYEEMIIPARSSKNVTGTASYSGSCSGSHCSGTCSTTTSETCGFTYQYDIDTYSYKTYNYKTVKIEYKGGEPINKYNGLDIKLNSNPSQTGSRRGYLDAIWDDDNCGAASSATGTGSCTYTDTCTGTRAKAGGGTESYTYSCTKSESLSGTVSYTGISRSFGKSNISTGGYKSTYWDGNQNTANRFKSAYATYAAKIKTLEDKLDKCNKYYTNYEGARDSEYQLSPTADFSYVKIYVDSSANPPIVTHDEPGTNYNVSCNIDNAVVANGGETDEHGVSLGLNAQQFNEIGGVNHTALVYNFTNGAALCNTTGAKSADYGCTHAIDENLSNRSYDQKYVTDAYYKGVCTSTNDTRDYYTLYPFGGVVNEATSLSVKHNTEYYVEYSALYGQFLTYWTLSGLGTEGKFDVFFSSGQTCTSDPEDISSILEGSAGLTCHYKVESELSRISGCDQSAIISHLSYNRGRCCTGPCTYTGEDELTYSFKAVDSAKLFPDDGVMSKTPNKEYAYNWLQTTNGVTVMNEIQNRANVNDKVFSNDRISYEFNLDVQDLTLIKNYNGNNSYNDFNLSCYCSDTRTIKENCSEPNYLFECKSVFLNNIVAGRLPGISQRLTGKNYLRNSSLIHYSS